MDTDTSSNETEVTDPSGWYYAPVPTVIYEPIGKPGETHIITEDCGGGFYHIARIQFVRGKPWRVENEILVSDTYLDRNFRLLTPKEINKLNEIKPETIDDLQNKIDRFTSRVIHGTWIETRDGYFRIADISALIRPDITINGKKDNACYIILRSGRQYWISEEDKNQLLGLIGLTNAIPQ
jgi:hypothetical protein